MSTYCAPCVADLALLRDAVTSVNGTAACVAHAVLLTHPGDNPQRRLQRLTELRSMAEGKLATASAEDVPSIELLVQEYALAGAMDMTVPLKELAGDRAPRPPKKRRDRGRDRGPRQEFPIETRPAAPDGADTAPPVESSEPGGAPATPASDNSSTDSAPEPDTSQEPGAREAQPSPPPPPHGDNLLAPEGVNSSSTTAQDVPDVKPQDAPVGE